MIQRMTRGAHGAPLAYLLLAIALIAPAPPLAAADRSLHLEIGDPARRGRESPVVLDGITDTRGGRVLSAADLAPLLAGYSLLLVGESHTDVEFHRVQLRVIEELVRSGREVSVGLEMYPYTEQRFLDQWVDGYLTEEGFLKLSRWYENWGYNWAYYRDIFLFAREHGVRLYAVNAPRQVVSDVRKKGFAALSPEEKAHIPADIAPSDAEHRALFRSYFDAEDPLHSGMSEEQWGGMLSAQTVWDATMAHNAVKALREQALREPGKPGSILVVLAGVGHVAYGVGIARQAVRWAGDGFDGRVATLAPVSVTDDEGGPVGSVQASYADFVWGVPAAGEPLYPSLGVSTQAPEGEGAAAGLKVILVSEETPGEAAGLQMGDLLRSLDGAELRSKADLNQAMARKRWGDRVVLQVDRGGEQKEVAVLLRRGATGGKPKPAG